MSNYQLKAKYGKQSVPVFKIRKNGSRHEIIDLKVKISLEGEILDSWTKGDNHQIIPTETQKNTCYALALKTDYDCPELYALSLARDMLDRHAHLSRVFVDCEQRVWERLTVDGEPHDHAFYSGTGPIINGCSVISDRISERVYSGVKGLRLMKTTQSGFKGYIEDEYTNLKPVGEGTSSPDRIMCTELEALWQYNQPPAHGYQSTNQAILNLLLEKWAGPARGGTYSKSVQETAHMMAQSVLNQFPEIESMYLGTPNIHHYRYGLEEFGLKNENVVFQSTDCHNTASGRIETRLSRRRARI